MDKIREYSSKKSFQTFDRVWNCSLQLVTNYSNAIIVEILFRASLSASLFAEN